MRVVTDIIWAYLAIVQYQNSPRPGRYPLLFPDSSLCPEADLLQDVLDAHTRTPGDSVPPYILWKARLLWQNTPIWRLPALQPLEVVYLIPGVLVDLVLFGYLGHVVSLVTQYGATASRDGLHRVRGWVRISSQCSPR